ncbi:nucleotide-binding protein [Dokdonella sp. MW10]|uniref:nucleotide-binding protein n=1 Tax=Dokdonella sp. MW10 TaxID=2992926 RepID=UPI003F7F93DF
MLKVMVASSKGGCGKSTIATTLAAYYALKGKATVLADADRQGSSSRWCARRAELDTAVLPVDATRKGWQQRIPSDADRVVIDTPAGVRASDIAASVDELSAIVVPVLPSTIDLDATTAFLEELAELPRIKRGKLPVGLVANRTKPWTNASQHAIDQIRELPFPLVATLRDTQAYVLMAGLGKSIFDYHSEIVRSHQADWDKLVRWLNKAA